MEFVRESSKELHASHPPRSARLACSSSLTGETHFGIGFEIIYQTFEELVLILGLKCPLLHLIEDDV